MKKKILYIIVILIISASIIIGEKIISIKKNEEIITYELQTNEYFENAPHIYKYKIDSIEELNTFYSLYSNKLSASSSKINIDKNYLKKNTIFIMVEQKNSGSIKLKLSSVTFDNNKVNFNIKRETPQIVTEDMSFWYIVALVPNTKLKNINTNDWINPSNINN